MEKSQKNKWDFVVEFITILSIVFIIIAYAFSSQITVLINVVLFLTLLFLFCFSLVKKIIYANKLPLFWLFEIVYLVLFLGIKTTYYKFKSGSTPFLITSLLIGTGCATLAAWMIFKNEKQFRGHLSKIFTSMFLGGFCVLIVLLNLNYALDTHKPRKYEIIITGKNIEHNRKAPDTYEFMFEENGKQRFIGVSEKIYNEYRTGDEYQLLIYEGAFGKEFYISKDAT